MSPATQDWQQNVDLFREEDRIKRVLDQCTAPLYKPDTTLSKELRQLMVFSKAASATAKHIKGPQDLDAAQSALNEIQSYRDRALAIWLDASDLKSKLDRGWYIIEQVLLLKQAVQSKTGAIQKAIVGQVALEIEDYCSDWETIVKQAEAVIRNCRDAYNVIYTQVEIAKQMWFQGQRVDATDAPKPMAQGFNRS